MRRFPLAALLAVRRREEDAALGALARALALEAARSAARDASARAAAAHARCRAQASGAIPGAAGQGALALRGAASFAERLRREGLALDRSLGAAAAALAVAEGEAARARGALAAARHGVRALERRRERWEAARRRARERREEIEADERVSALEAVPSRAPARTRW